MRTHHDQLDVVLDRIDNNSFGAIIDDRRLAHVERFILQSFAKLCEFPFRTLAEPFVEIFDFFVFRELNGFNHVEKCDGRIVLSRNLACRLNRATILLGEVDRNENVLE